LGFVSRVVQGVVTGIGFVGAGVIFHRAAGRRVAGLTTAAAIWYSAALGVACGLGQSAVAVGGLAVALFILIAGGPVERYFERLLVKQPPPGKSPDDTSAG
jgi:putative Mg2+ transporter-C (MgtC) family protein